MLTKTIKYTDYNGTERKEEFCFNLNEAELTEMEAGTEGGLTVKLQKIVDSKNGPIIMKTFKDIILKSYGEKSEDGIHFRKSEAISKDFEQSEPYNALFMELLSDSNAAMTFIRGILPKNLVSQMDASKERAATIAAKNN